MRKYAGAVSGSGDFGRRMSYDVQAGERTRWIVVDGGNGWYVYFDQTPVPIQADWTGHLDEATRFATVEGAITTLARARFRSGPRHPISLTVVEEIPPTIPYVKALGAVRGR